MPAFPLSPDANAAKLFGIAAFADLGPAPSRIQFFGTEKPAFGAAPGAAPLVEIILTKPCGALVAGVLVLTQADVAGDLVLVQGSAKWGRWLNGDDDLIGDGNATDDTGAGIFKIFGTTGTILYAGARAILGTTELS